MTFTRRRWIPAATLAVVTLMLAGCEPPEATRPSTSTTDNSPVSEPIPLPSAPPVEVSDLPPEISAPITAPSNAPLPVEGDILTSGEVLDRLRARLSTPTCIVGPNNTRWRHKYAGYPQHFADEVQATLPMMLVVLDALEQRKLPGEFALIPIVESWYRPETYSFGGAAGMWQMLNETSRNNGATVINGYDGRLSALESTEAALTYLGKLHGMFNDWRLTAMAYNSGEYRLMRTMSPEELQERSAGGVHYRRPSGLAGGTYEYVSKMRALTCLLAQPERQGIPLVNSVPITHWVPYQLPADVDSLDELALRLGIDAQELKTFNHGYRNGQVVDGAPRTVLVPASTRPHWASAGAPAAGQRTAESTSMSTPVNPYVAAPFHPRVDAPAPIAPLAIPAVTASTTAAPVATAPAAGTVLHSVTISGSAATTPSVTAAQSTGIQPSAVRTAPMNAPSATFKPPATVATPSSVQSGTTAIPSARLSTPPATAATTVPRTAATSATSEVTKANVVAVPSMTSAARPSAAGTEPSTSPPATVVAAPSRTSPLPNAATVSSRPSAPAIAAPSITSTTKPSPADNETSTGPRTPVVATQSQTSPAPNSATASSQPSAPAVVAPSATSGPSTVAIQATIVEPTRAPKSETPTTSDGAAVSVASMSATQTQAPAQQPAAPVRYQYGLHSHIVGDDETLAGIAQRYGLSVDQLQEWNHLDPNEPVKPGQQLKLQP